MQHDPRELLARAANLIDMRGGDYGGIEQNFQLIADLSTLRLGRKIHPYEVATILACVKQARLFANPTHIDSRLDLCNYETFAALFAQDYLNAAPNDVDYQKREELPIAKMEMPERAATEPPIKTEKLVDVLEHLNGEIAKRVSRREARNGDA